MRFFSKKTKNKEEVEKVEKRAGADSELKPKVVATPAQSFGDLSWVLHMPRMSEKAMYASDKNTYVFNVDPRANKKQIRDAIKIIYKIDAVKVNVLKIARKNVRNQRTGIKGVKSGGKKAYVYLKEGDKISVV